MIYINDLTIHLFFPFYDEDKLNLYLVNLYLPSVENESI